MNNKIINNNHNKYGNFLIKNNYLINFKLKIRLFINRIINKK